MLPVFKWRKYTRVKRIGISTKFHGKSLLRIYGISKKDLNKELIIREIEINGSDGSIENEIWFPINELPEFAFVKIYAKDEVTVSSLEYLFDVDLEEVRIGCCICTFRREEDVERNLLEITRGIFNNKESVLHNTLEVFIADNGKTLSLFENEALKEYEDLIHIFPNKNYGGSAGFTRCMIESAMNDKFGLDYIILMDDDATIRSYVLEKTAIFLMTIKPEYREYFVGGAMLFLETPTIQKENGCYFKNGHLVMKDYFSDLSVRENILKNEREEKLDYNGWYYCCIPTSVVKKSLLPTPLFFTWDDAEYGIRNAKGRIITLNGICIWHPAHDAKPGSFRNYYGMRNTCIMRSEFEPDITFEQIEKVFVRRIILFMMQFQYNSARYLIMGIRDFYKGIDWYKAQDAEELNNIVRSSFPDRNLVQLEKSINKYDHGKDMSKKEWLIRMAANTVCPGKKRIYDIQTPRKSVDYLFANEVEFFNKTTKMGYSFKKDYSEAFSIICDYLKLRSAIKKSHDRVWKEWNVRVTELQTIEFWKEYLSI